jgi:hypothetical protein
MRWQCESFRQGSGKAGKSNIASSGVFLNRSGFHLDVAKMVIAQSPFEPSKPAQRRCFENFVMWS